MVSQVIEMKLNENKIEKVADKIEEELNEIEEVEDLPIR